MAMNKPVKSADVFGELRKIFDLPDDLLELHIHLKINTPVIIETTQLAKTINGAAIGEFKRKWTLKEIIND